MYLCPSCIRGKVDHNGYWQSEHVLAEFKSNPNAVCVYGAAKVDTPAFLALIVRIPIISARCLHCPCWQDIGTTITQKINIHTLSIITSSMSDGISCLSYVGIHRLQISMIVSTKPNWLKWTLCLNIWGGYIPHRACSMFHPWQHSYPGYCMSWSLCILYCRAIRALHNMHLLEAERYVRVSMGCPHIAYSWCFVLHKVWLRVISGDVCLAKHAFKTDGCSPVFSALCASNLSCKYWRARASTTQSSVREFGSAVLKVQSAVTRLGICPTLVVCLQSCGTCENQSINMHWRHLQM